jgi:phosphate starvation-inducible PhoH-like protein
MRFTNILPFMFLFSFKTTAMRTSYRHNQLIMRTKKTVSNAMDYDSGTTRKSRTKSIAPLYKPRSQNQREYVGHLYNSSVPIVFGVGPAGCGKTLFACVRAIEGLKRGDFQKIVLTRPIVPVEEEELGFLPGSLVKKMDPWTRPLMDIFLEHYPQHEIDFMLGSGVIEISPLAYMRGRTFKRSFIIADEMQNSTPNQMLMLTTRIGDGSKMVITGDLKQTDRSVDNGLLDIMNKIRDYGVKDGDCFGDQCGIELIEMNTGDIERSPIVSKIIEIYNPKPKPSAAGQSIQKQTTDSIPPPYNSFYNDAALIPIHHMIKTIPDHK